MGENVKVWISCAIVFVAYAAAMFLAITRGQLSPYQYAILVGSGVVAYVTAHTMRVRGMHTAPAATIFFLPILVSLLAIAASLASDRRLVSLALIINTFLAAYRLRDLIGGADSSASGPSASGST